LINSQLGGQEKLGIYRVRDIYFAGRKWPLDRKKLLIIDQNNKIIK
jgi:hypothetical protein